jgi:hypothetical protein
MDGRLRFDPPPQRTSSIPLLRMTEPPVLLFGTHCLQTYSLMASLRQHCWTSHSKFSYLFPCLRPVVVLLLARLPV